MRLESVCRVLPAACSGLLFACASTVSPQPLANSVPDGVDVYLYGSPHERSTVRASVPEPIERRSASEPKVPSRSAKRETTAERKVAAARKKAASATARAANEADSGLVNIAGEYRGTDWVTIKLPGIPDGEQKDEKARVVIRRLGDSSGEPSQNKSSGDGGDGEGKLLNNTFSLSVIDTNSGDELCTLKGELNGSTIGFRPGQTCFSGILGVPMEAKTADGEAHVDGTTLSVEFTVELRVQTPEAELEGTLDYSFEGEISD